VTGLTLTLEYIVNFESGAESSMTLGLEKIGLVFRFTLWLLNETAENWYTTPGFKMITSMPLPGMIFVSSVQGSTGQLGKLRATAPFAT
jgi:hypothetical protein